MIIELAFRAWKRYDSLYELLKKLNLEGELKKDIRLTNAELIGKKVKFRLLSGAERAIFIVRKDLEQTYALLLPDNQVLYDRIYTALQNKNLEINAEMLDEEEIKQYNFSSSDMQLLKSF